MSESQFTHDQLQEIAEVVRALCDPSFNKVADALNLVVSEVNRALDASNARVASDLLTGGPITLSVTAPPTRTVKEVVRDEHGEIASIIERPA